MDAVGIRDAWTVAATYCSLKNDLQLGACVQAMHMLSKWVPDGHSKVRAGRQTDSLRVTMPVKLCQEDCIPGASSKRPQGC